MKISFLRVAVCAVVGTVVIGTLLACFLLRSRTTGVDTSTVRKEIRFYRSGTEWFADVPQHTKAENQMVAGADTLLDEVSDGADEEAADSYSAMNNNGGNNPLVDAFLTFLNKIS